MSFLQRIEEAEKCIEYKLPHAGLCLALTLPAMYNYIIYGYLEKEEEGKYYAEWVDKFCSINPPNFDGAAYPKLNGIDIYSLRNSLFHTNGYDSSKNRIRSRNPQQPINLTISINGSMKYGITESKEIKRQKCKESTIQKNRKKKHINIDLGQICIIICKGARLAYCNIQDKDKSDIDCFDQDKWINSYIKNIHI